MIPHLSAHWQIFYVKPFYISYLLYALLSQAEIDKVTKNFYGKRNLSEKSISFLMFCSPDIFFHSWNNVKSDCLVTDNLLHPTIFLYQSSECIDRIHLLSQICQKRYLTLIPVSSRTSLAAQSVKLSFSLIFPFGNPQHFFLPDMENH